MKNKVAIFLIDGMRPDSLSAERTPVLASLMAEGAAALKARTVMPSVTLPCIYSLFAGTAPHWHGVDSNLWRQPLNATPMLFELVYAAGGRALSVFNWEELRDLSKPGSLETAVSIRLDEDHPSKSDEEVALSALNWMVLKDYDLMFIYLGGVDAVGHAHGWMSPAYLDAVAAADRAVGLVMGGLPLDTHVIVTADHGGHGRAHGYDIVEDMTIPVILHGPSVQPGNRLLEGVVSILDIAPTAAALLGVAPQAHWEGKNLLS